MIKKLIFTLTLAVGLTSLVYAAPSISGPTGLISIPTGEYTPPREFSLGVDFLTTSTMPKTDQYFYKLNLGTYKNWELGIVAGKVPTEGAFVNLKYYLTTDGERFPISFALGVQNLFAKEKTDVYMVASKRFPANFSLHLGFKANFGKDEVYPALMGGVEYFISNHVSLIGDAAGSKKLYQFSGGMRVVLLESLMLQLSAVDISNVSPSGTMFGIGVSYGASM